VRWTRSTRSRVRTTSVSREAISTIRHGYGALEAAQALRPPFVEADRHETLVEELDGSVGPFDVVWATHALVLPHADEDAGLWRFHQEVDVLLLGAAFDGLIE
jgi:hypothetical protein